MQIREVTIKNFRGVRSFHWQPLTPLACIVGAGDSGKSTILDALEMALGTRWLAFTDVDFTDGDTTKVVEIIVTVGKLSSEALRENRMGLHLRGWTAPSDLRDEPEADDEPVVTVRLTVDSSLEPAWELITDRGEPRALSPRDRALFGLVRLGGDAERHLTWGQGSALARLTADRDEAAPLLADAYRRARDLLKAGTLPALDMVAATVRDAAMKLGAHARDDYAAGLDTQRSSMSLGTLSLHANGVPLRLAGLGTRRLVSLAVQQMAIPDGAIVLIDEVEHGLEPHRIRHALRMLRESLSAGTGQVILTTHSSTTIVELSCPQLAICRRSGHALGLGSPAPALQALLRRVPEAFLSRRILVCEGKTEVGLLRGLRSFWAERHSGEPPEASGTVVADGNGHQAVVTACELAQLGFPVALMRDSDVTLTANESQQLSLNKVPVFEWSDALSTEERLLRDLSVAGVQKLLDVAYDFASETSVLDAIRKTLGARCTIAADFASWAIEGHDPASVRNCLGTAAKKGCWLKQIDPAERVGLTLQSELVGDPTTPTATTLSEVEAWVYGG